MTKALHQYLNFEYVSLASVLTSGALLGKPNDLLAQEYSRIVARQAQISEILTLTRDTLIESITPED